MCFISVISCPEHNSVTSSSIHTKLGVHASSMKRGAGSKIHNSALGNFRVISLLLFIYGHIYWCLQACLATHPTCRVLVCYSNLFLHDNQVMRVTDLQPQQTSTWLRDHCSSLISPSAVPTPNTASVSQHWALSTV